MLLECDIVGKGAEEDVGLINGLHKERASIASEELVGTRASNEGKLPRLEVVGGGR